MIGDNRPSHFTGGWLIHTRCVSIIRHTTYVWGSSANLFATRADFTDALRAQRVCPGAWKPLKYWCNTGGVLDGCELCRTHCSSGLLGSGAAISSVQPDSLRSCCVRDLLALPPGQTQVWSGWKTENLSHVLLDEFLEFLQAYAFGRTNNRSRNQYSPMAQQVQ